MVTRDTPWPEGTPCWVDLGVSDFGKAARFYSGLLGWSVQAGPPEAGGYAVCTKAGRPVAGIGPKQGPAEAPPYWTTYLAANNVDEIAAKVTKAKGQVLMGPMDVLDVGRMAVAVDVAGAAFGIWQARKHIGVGIANEPGTLCWNENMTRDFAANKNFYAAVFGYEYEVVEDGGEGGFQYNTIKVAGNVVGGIGALTADFPAEVPPHWMTYFAVRDTDAAINKVTELGGKVIRPAFDMPYGRMAVVHDDQGAVFSLISVPVSDA